MEVVEAGPGDAGASLRGFAAGVEGEALSGDVEFAAEIVD